MKSITQETPKCPKCSKPMILRKPRNGAKWAPFYGCSGYRSGCRATMPYNSKPKQLSKIAKPSQYQETVFDWVLNEKGNTVVTAAAGSGKTTTIEHVIALLTEAGITDLVYAVFNTHVRNAAQDKGITQAMTTHQMGLACISEHIGRRPEINANKVNDIIKNLIRKTWDEEKWMISPVQNLVGKLKNTLAPQDTATLEKIADKFGIELNGSQARIFQLVRETMTINNQQTSVVNFDDMLWFPHKFKMQPTRYSWVLGDEVQDWNKAQIQLILKSVKENGRVLAVGDKNQAMYGFRGADIEAMANLTTALQAIEMPLSISYRCPTAHVALVNHLFPDIAFEAYENAIEGEIYQMSVDKMLGTVRDGDFVLCRTNAPLVKPVFSLIRQGVKAIIRGRDIGQGLIGLIEKFNTDNVDEMLTDLTYYRSREVGKLLAAEKTSQAQALDDKVQTIIALSEGCDRTYQIKQKIKDVFTDKKEGVIFSTVHRAKGDEANNVYILEPQLIPHPMCQKDWEKVQEANILYVAITRAKVSLNFVGGMMPNAFEYHEVEEELGEVIEEMIDEWSGELEDKQGIKKRVVATGMQALKEENEQKAVPVIPDCPF